MFHISIPILFAFTKNVKFLDCQETFFFFNYYSRSKKITTTLIDTHRLIYSCDIKVFSPLPLP